MSTSTQEKETIIFVEFFSKPKRPLKPFDVITLVEVPPRYGRPGYQIFHYYDCAFMKDGTIIFDMSGFGGLPDDTAYVCRGPWWAVSWLNVEDNGQRRVKRLPKSLRQWPPDGIEARIVECPKCGFLPDDNYCGSPCEHLVWHVQEEEWVERRRPL